MAALTLWGFMVPPLLAAAAFFVLGKHPLGRSNRFLSGAMVGQTVLSLALGIYLAATARLPLYLLDNHYLYLDRLRCTRC
jgi:hypothetical protein